MRDCADYKWHNELSQICRNGPPELRGGFIDTEDGCDWWEKCEAEQILR